MWEPLTEAEPQPRMWITNRRHAMRKFMKLTLNGLLLPFFGLWGNRLVMNRGDRGALPVCWGAAQITYIDRKNQQQMTVRHHKLRTLVLGLRMLWNLAKLAVTYPSLRARWRAGFDGLTSEEFWEGQFFPADSQGQAPGKEPART